MLASQQIVERARALLLNATSAADRVYIDGEWPVAVELLPAMLLEAGEESVEALTMHADPVLQHELELVVQVATAGPTARSDAGALVQQLLALLYATEPGAGVPQLSGNARISRDSRLGGETQVRHERLALNARYQTRASAPGQLL